METEAWLREAIELLRKPTGDPGVDAVCAEAVRKGEAYLAALPEEGSLDTSGASC